MPSILFKNANIIFPEKICRGELLVRDGKIAMIEEQLSAVSDQIIDVEGRYLSPGFIDVHTHGAGNSDFMDGTLEDIYNACAVHMQHGTTSIVPTTLTSTKEALLDFINLFNTVELEKEGLCHILGLHLEGPYFAHDHRGAQDAKYLRNPQPDEYLDVLKRTNRICRWSFAVELEGSDALLVELKKHHIVSSLAHSDASCQQVEKARENGLCALTHFYSCMTTVKRVNAYRIAGAIEAGYLFDDLYVEAIADGKHLPAELLKLIYKIKGPEHVCLVTDSMRGAGMPDGEYILGARDTGMTVVVEGGVANLPDRSGFGGSVATTDRLVRTVCQLTDAPLYHAVQMMSLTPATLLGIQHKTGSIAVGKAADLLIFDDDIQIQKVFVDGKDVYTRQ